MEGDMSQQPTNCIWGLQADSISRALCSLMNETHSFTNDFVCHTAKTTVVETF